MSQPDLSSVKGIYFDLDDTLCAYWEASKYGLQRAFEQLAPEGITVPEMLRHWAEAFRKFGGCLKGSSWYPLYLVSGEPTRTEQMRLALLRAGHSDAKLAKDLSDVYAQERNGALRLFEDAVPTLKALKAHYPIGLITNGPADIQRQELETLGIEDLFDPIFIEGEMKVGKPDPVVCHNASQAMGLSGPELLFVGNSYSHDIKPALQSGWRGIWVRRSSDVPPSASMPEVKPAADPEPDAEISHLSELLQLLQKG